MKFILLITVAFLMSCSGSPSASTTSDQYYEVSTLTINGSMCTFYCHYTVSSEIESEGDIIESINLRIGRELTQLSDKSTLIDLVESIDTLGPFVENRIKNEYNLSNLKVKIGVQESTKELLLKEKVNLDKVEFIAYDEHSKNFISDLDLNSKEKSKSEYLTLSLRTKDNWDVKIEYFIFYRVERGFGNPIDSLSKEIENVIIDSMPQFDVSEMWSSKMEYMDSMETIMARIVQKNYPETNRVSILDIVFPEKVKKHFLEIEGTKDSLRKKQLEIITSKILLKEKLEKNNDLSEPEVMEIKKEINALESEYDLNKEKISSMKYEL